MSMDTPGYEELAVILQAAFDQAAKGKGAERHANSKPFHEQPMQSISDLFDSDKGIAFQIVKKLREGLDMPEYERLERELLGVIVYTAGAILWHKRRHVAANAALVSAVEPPVTFNERCAEIDAEMQAAALEQRAYPPEPPVISLTDRTCPHCGREEGKKHRLGCPTITTPRDQGPHTWDAECDVECILYYPGFTVGRRYAQLAVNHDANTVTLYSDDKTIAVFGFKEITNVFKLHSRPVK